MSFPIPSLNTSGSFVFELCSRQTDKQTDRLEHPMYATDIVGVGINTIN